MSDALTVAARDYPFRPLQEWVDEHNIPLLAAEKLFSIVRVLSGCAHPCDLPADALTGAARDAETVRAIFEAEWSWSMGDESRVRGLAAVARLLAAVEAAQESARGWQEQAQRNIGVVFDLERRAETAKDEAAQYQVDALEAMERLTFARAGNTYWKESAARWATQSNEWEARAKTAEARAVELEGALEGIRADVHDWRHGTDWQGEGSGQMPDRVLILRIEDALRIRAVLVAGVCPADSKPGKDLGGDETSPVVPS